LIGIKLSKFKEYSEQEELFDFEEIKRRRMIHAINIIRSQYGYGIIEMGTS
jgi:hypothetical protein